MIGWRGSLNGPQSLTSGGGFLRVLVYFALGIFTGFAFGFAKAGMPFVAQGSGRTSQDEAAQITGDIFEYFGLYPCDSINLHSFGTDFQIIMGILLRVDAACTDNRHIRKLFGKLLYQAELPVIRAMVNCSPDASTAR